MHACRVPEALQRLCQNSAGPHMPCMHAGPPSRSGMQHARNRCPILPRALAVYPSGIQGKRRVHLPSEGPRIAKAETRRERNLGSAVEWWGGLHPRETETVPGSLCAILTLCTSFPSPTRDQCFLRLPNSPFSNPPPTLPRGVFSARSFAHFHQTRSSFLLLISSPELSHTATSPPHLHTPTTPPSSSFHLTSAPTSVSRSSTVRRHVRPGEQAACYSNLP